MKAALHLNCVSSLTMRSTLSCLRPQGGKCSGASLGSFRALKPIQIVGIGCLLAAIAIFSVLVTIDAHDHVLPQTWHASQASLTSTQAGSHPRCCMLSTLYSDLSKISSTRHKRPKKLFGRARKHSFSIFPTLRGTTAEPANIQAKYQGGSTLIIHASDWSSRQPTHSRLSTSL